MLSSVSLERNFIGMFKNNADPIMTLASNEKVIKY